MKLIKLEFSWEMWGCNTKKPSVRGVWIFSGTTHSCKSEVPIESPPTRSLPPLWNSYNKYRRGVTNHSPIELLCYGRKQGMGAFAS